MTRIRIDSSSRMPLDPNEIEFEPVAPGSPHFPTPYIELTARTNFSFLRGASSPQEMVQHASMLGYDAIAITDCDGLYGIVRAHEEAERQKIRLIVGCELTLDPKGSLTVLVENHTGYTNLCRILTESHRRHPKGPSREKERTKNKEMPKNLYAGITYDFICEHAEGLYAIAPPFTDEVTLGALKEAFGDRLSLAMIRHLDGADLIRYRHVSHLSETLGIPIVATNAVRFAERAAKPVYDTLHCIREGITLDKAGRTLPQNAEMRLKSSQEMEQIFAEHPSWIARTRQIADACTFKMTELRYQFPYRFGNDRHQPTTESADECLRRLTYEGARKRYDGTIPQKVLEILEKELALIALIEVAPYFLSVHEVIEIARERDILCQGRGSAANSAVCYCLGITAVDPSIHSLLFERFLSAERREPPDIDVDFEHERREEVIQELYRRYGRDHAAMVSEVICYRGKSALRDVGKVFGLSLEQVDRLSQVVSWWDRVSDIDPKRLQHAGFDANDSRISLTLAMARAIQGFPRHLSIHVGGFVLSAGPLYEVAPVEPATMADRTVIPWDKDDLDTLGFFKVDVLGLGILTAIRRALTLAQHDPRIQAETAIDRIARVPPNDPTVYEALCNADTVGVFQIESRAQMAMLPRLQPREFYDLVVEVAIVRPGPIQGGMVHPYLKRKRGEEPVVMPHECLRPTLERTLGVPLFQEQVMQIAIVGAGYTGGEADQLRRDMAAWKRTGSLERHKKRLADGFRAKGISQEFSDRLYAQIHGFAEYGFPESHAASFALLVYVSAWLKVHHPAEFAVALINSQPMGFYSANTILQDAERHKVEVRSISIEASEWDCTVERNESSEGPNAIRIGFGQIKGFSEASAERIRLARNERRFESVDDLAARADLTQEDLHMLAESGALESLIRDRREALWRVALPTEPTGSLLAGVSLNESPPVLRPLTRAAQLVLDYECTGISVSEHPMRFLRATLPKKVLSARDLNYASDKSRVTVAGMAICRQRPATASGVVFITLEDETGFINLVIYSRIFEEQRYIATGFSLLMAHGRVERDGSVIHVLADRLEGIRISSGGESDEGLVFPHVSRDFH